MFKDKKVIIFDIDGTLLDTMWIWNAIDEELIKKIGDGTIDEVDIGQQRNTILKKFSKSKDSYLEYCGFLKEKYSSKMSKEEIKKMRYEIANNYLKNIVDYKPNAEKVLHYLKQKGFLLAIASTTRNSAINIYKTENKNIKSKANFDDIFSIIITSDDVKEKKPNPEVHYKILEKLKVNPEECLIIEDALVGIEAAKNANIDVVSIYDKYSDLDREKINESAKYNFKDFSEMLEKIREELENQ